MAERDVKGLVMGNHFLQLQTSERDVARFGDAVRVGGGRIDPKIERDMCNSVIAALCAAYGREPTDFVMQLILRPGSHPGDAGTVTLALSYTGLRAPGLDTADLREFCRRELLDRMPEIHETSQRIATGEVPIVVQSASPGATMPLPFSGSPADTENEVVTIGIKPPRDQGQIARDTLSLQLVERLPGKVIPYVQAATGDDPPQQIGGVKIVKPQRRPGRQEERSYYGHVNSLSLDPATIEIKASERDGDARAASHKLTYEFTREDKSFDQLIELLSLGSRIRVKFIVEVSTEVGVGTQRTKYTLKSWSRLDQSRLDRAAA